MNAKIENHQQQQQQKQQKQLNGNENETRRENLSKYLMVCEVMAAFVPL